MIKRRTFLQLFAIPALAALWPRAAEAQAAQDGLAYTDSDGNTDLSTLHDANLTTGVTYQS